MKKVRSFLLVASTLSTSLSLNAGGPATFEAWCGPGTASSDPTTVVTLANSSDAGVTGILEFLVAAQVVATSAIQVPLGGFAEAVVPQAVPAGASFLVRAVADGSVRLTLESAPRVTTTSFEPHETLSAGDVALFPSELKTAADSLFGLVCVSPDPCRAVFLAVDAGNAERASGTLSSQPWLAAERPGGEVLPGIVGDGSVRLRVRAEAGRLQPYIVSRDNRVVSPRTVDRTHGVTYAPPLACRLPDDCFVGYYFDRDPGPGIRDYAGGAVTYDTHFGVDYLVGGFARMDLGVDVLAVADGQVERAHDGEFDRCTSWVECENAVANLVVLRHADGSRSEYLHLKKRSVLVDVGDQVKRGQKIAEVGSSGFSASPHLHLSWFPPGRDERVDPFVLPDDGLVTPWEKPEPYMGYTGARAFRAGVALPTRDFDPAPIAVASRHERLTAFLAVSRAAAGRSYRMRLFEPAPRAAAVSVDRIRLLAPGGVLSQEQARSTPDDAPFLVFYFDFQPGAKGPSGEWWLEFLEDDRVLTRRSLLVY